MNRNLREVRRYWPRATVRDRPPAFPYYAICANGWSDKWIKLLPNCGMACVVDGRNWYRCDWHKTIASAMRAAGFGARPEYATRGYHFAVWRAKKVSSRTQVRLWRAGCGWAAAWLIREYERFDRLPALVDRQRPRKGARLGRRKREALRRI